MVPVAVGGACAVGQVDARWWRVVLAAVVSLALQVGVNYANDYSDGIRGTDEKRVGPLRLVGSGLVPAPRVKAAAFASFFVAATAGLVLALMTSLWLVAVGLCAILAAWFYTGGPKPYGYAGLGEVFVFVFFGLVATVGTTYAVTQTLPAVSWWAGCAAGCFSCAMLVTNNLRDIPGDTVSSKRTLAVRMGDARTRVFFQLLFVDAAVCVVLAGVAAGPWALLGILGVATAVVPVRTVRAGAMGRDLIAVLGGVGRAQLLFGVSFSAGLVLALS